MYFYLKALHIIFVVTWFSGMFYIVRLFVYNTEANNLPEPGKTILQKQYGIMIKRLWIGITWPSAILTLVFGVYVLFKGNWNLVLFTPAGRWLLIKIGFVIGLYAYHLTLNTIYRQQREGIFKFSSQQLRIWNEVATIFLVVIVILATVKRTMSWFYGLVGLIGFVVVLMLAIRIYKRIREK